MSSGEELFNAEEAERLRAIISNLPTLGPNITDPARHEKLLSFLTSNAEKGVAHTDWIVHELGALEAIEASLQHADYRVPALSVRFLGHLVRANPTVFDLLYASNQPTLQYILSQLTAVEREVPLSILSACLESLSLLLAAESAARWLMETGKLPDIIIRSLECDCIHVTTAASKLLMIVINHSDVEGDRRETYQGLAASVVDGCRLYDVIHSWLQPSHPRQHAALELIWSLSDAKSDAAYKFLKDAELVPACMDLLLIDTDRIARSRILDSMKLLFGWVPHPALLACGQHSMSELATTAASAAEFIFTHWFAQAVNGPATSFQFTASFDILDILAGLAHRSQQAWLVGWVDNTIWRSFWILHGVDAPKLGKAAVSSDLEQESGKLFALIHTLVEKSGSECYKANQHALLHRLSSSVQHVSHFSVLLAYEIVAACLADPLYWEDQKLMKSVIGTLARASAHDTGLENCWEALQNLKKFLMGSVTRTQTVEESLKVIQSITLKPNGSRILDHQLKEVLKTLLNDRRWDVRDTALHFIANLFDSHENSLVSPRTDFAVKQALPDLVIANLKDDQPFVRSACLVALEKTVVNPRGYVYLHTRGLDKDLAQDLVRVVTTDTEAFVRRSAMDVLISLARQRRSTGHDMDLETLLPPVLLTRAMSDPDSEVRVRGLQSLSLLFNNTCNTVEQISTLGDPETSSPTVFWTANAPSLILNSTTDESRLVREEAHRIISTNLLPSLAPYLPTQNGKRQRETTDNRLEMFARQLVEVDMERLRVGCVPEHLYQEVLDVDESVLVEWEDDGVGNNVLACYDC